MKDHLIATVALVIILAIGFGVIFFLILFPTWALATLGIVVVVVSYRAILSDLRKPKQMGDTRIGETDEVDRIDRQD